MGEIHPLEETQIKMLVLDYCLLLPLLQPSGPELYLGITLQSLHAISANSQANLYPIPERLEESCSPPQLSAT